MADQMEASVLDVEMKENQCANKYEPETNVGVQDEAMDILQTPSNVRFIIIKRILAIRFEFQNLKTYCPVL